LGLEFHFGSGSPFAWTVWLALEHKGIPYTPRRRMFDGGELQTPEFLALNPRGQVPVIVHDGFVLFESSAIVEYLDAAWPERPLFPADAQRAAVARRLIAETHAYLYERVGDLLGMTLFTRTPGPAEEVEAAVAGVAAELERFDAYLGDGDWFAGTGMTAADLTIYPQLRMVQRLQERQPQHGAGDAIPERLSRFMGRIEALAYYGRTVPPHWTAG
jgi:glutathione S-transferase